MFLKTLPAVFYRRPCEEVARDLLGRYIVRRFEGQRLVARIVETEAYLGEGDRASHAWHGRMTQRNRQLFARGGTSYVFFIYGMYFCFNAVTGEQGVAAAALVRAVEPVEGEDVMAGLRNLRRPPRPGDLGGGPGKLCQALAIDKQHDGVSLRGRELRLTQGRPVTSDAVAVGPRVGVDYAGEAALWPLRFALAGSRHVSKPWPWAGSD
jgi:DNA-3-methyladenine glycosylase